MVNEMTWLFSILMAMLSISAGVYSKGYFACEDYINKSHPNPQLHTSKANSSVVFIYMKISAYGQFNFKEANNICKWCHSADLILPQDVPDVIDEALPAWVAATAYVELNNNHTNNLTWTQNTVENFVLPAQVDVNGIFAMLAQPTAFRNHTFLAIPLNTNFYGFYDNYPRGANPRVNSIVCKSTKSSDNWSFVDETCVYHPKFGCHTYENHMQRLVDLNGTASMNFSRRARPCPIANCTCSVMQWSQWSTCNEMICTDKPRNRTRSRKVVEICLRNYLHEKLLESEPCPLPDDCDHLRKFHESNDSLTMRE